METIQIYLLMSQVIGAARLEMTVGSEPITSLFTVLDWPIVTAAARLWRNKRWKISSLISGRVKGKADGKGVIMSSFWPRRPSENVLGSWHALSRAQVC